MMYLSFLIITSDIASVRFQIHGPINLQKTRSTSKNRDYMNKLNGMNIQCKGYKT